MTRFCHTYHIVQQPLNVSASCALWIVFFWWNDFSHYHIKWFGQSGHAERIFLLWKDWIFKTTCRNIFSLNIKSRKNRVVAMHTVLWSSGWSQFSCSEVKPDKRYLTRRKLWSFYEPWQKLCGRASKLGNCRDTSRASFCVSVCVCVHVEHRCTSSSRRSVQPTVARSKGLWRVLWWNCVGRRYRRRARGGGSAFYIFSDLRGLEKGFF